MQQKTIGLYIIASAIIWAGVIISCSIRLHGTTCYNAISPLLIGGFMFHLLFVWGPLSIQFNKSRK